MRSLALLGALAALFGSASVAAVAGTSGRGEPAAAAFRLADGSAGCVYDDGRLACRARGSTATLELTADGDSRFTGAPVEWDASTPVLPARESWWHGAFGCRVTGGRIACAAGGGSISV